MKRGLLIEAAGALAVLLILLFTAWEIRNFLILIAVLGSILALGFGGAFATLALFKYHRRYEKINVRSDGGYVQKHGRIVRLDPLTPIESYDVGNNIIDIMPVQAQKRIVESVNSQEYDTTELDELDDELPELPAPRSKTKELTSPVSDELREAQQCWKEGAHNREKMAEAMRALGRYCTRERATQLIRELREKRMI